MARPAYIPYTLYRAGDRILGMDSHIWDSVGDRVLRILLIRPPDRLLPGPGRDGLVLDSRVSSRIHIEDLSHLSRLKPSSYRPGLEEVLAMLYGIPYTRGSGSRVGDALLHLLSKVLLKGSRSISPLGRTMWLRLEFDETCRPLDPAYKLLYEMDDGAGGSLYRICRRCSGVA